MILITTQDSFHLTQQHMYSSKDTYTISIPQNSKLCKSIEQGHTFAVNLIKEYTSYASLRSREDFTDVQDLPVEECTSIEAFKLKDVRVLECEVINKIKIDDYILFLGRIVKK